MADDSWPTEPMNRDPEGLRKDLGTEYYAILEVVSGFDQRELTVKGWSVTLSLAALGIGFAQGHAAYFALAAFSGLCFWVLEAAAKGHQLRYYSRMRDIEVACGELNRVQIGELGDVSAPRIDMYWGFPRRREATDWRTDRVWRRDEQGIRRMLRRRWLMPHVALPHALAVAAGLGLSLAVLLGAPGLGGLAW